MTTHTDEFLGELRLGRQLTTTGQVAAGGLVIVTGLLFLLVGRTVALIGPRAALASVLTGAVLGLTLLSVLELLGGSGERGGTYILIQETLGGPGAFLAGWSILAGSVALSAGLARTAARHVLLVFPLAGSATSIALAILGVLVMAQLLQFLRGRSLLWPALLLLMALGVVVFSAVSGVSLQSYGSAPAVPPRELMRSVAWLSVSYAAFEGLLASRRQIRDPGRLLPPAILWTLVVGSLILGVTGLVVAGLRPSVSSEDTALVTAVAAASFSPLWAVGLLAIVALVLSGNGCLMVAARQMHAFSREGALPRGLRRVWRPFSMPPLLFAALALITAPLITWAQTRWLTDLAAGAFLVAMTVLNVAAVHSRRTEPGRRRPFVVPFYPLVPAVAIVINLVLLGSLSRSGLVSNGLWLLLGVLFYLAYARGHQVAARQGVLVFGRERRRDERKGVYRILVPLSAGEERRLLLRLAAALAHQLDGEIIPLQVIPMVDPLAIEEGRRIAQERNTLFQWSTRLGVDTGVPMTPITRLAPSVPEGIIDTAFEESCDLILLPWTVTATPTGFRMGHVLDPVVRRAPCDVAVVAYRANELEGRGAKERKRLSHPPTPWHPGSILVPTAGGPHAPLAVYLALLLAREFGAAVTAVYVVEPGASAEEIAEGEARIEQTLATVRQPTARLPGLDGRAAALEGIPIDTRVIGAEDVVAGIAEAGAASDLVLIGASEESLIDQVLFGSVPEQVARVCPTPVVMVKRYRGLPRFWLQRTWDALYEALPELSGEERVEVYREVRRGARPDVDFFVMMGLAAIIATFGLLQSSAAVIIGAMLVAPLFTPVLALSLAIVQGDGRLARLAVESILKGIALAIGLSALLAAVSSVRTATPEITARSHPNLFDLVVALASGAAGAYAIARKDVAAALPGVAIAAALVPPLSVVGIGLALGSLHVAGGGGLLFATNLIAIALAGSITLLLLGFRPAHRGEREVRLRLGLVTTMVLLIVITIPLAVVFMRSASRSRTRQVVEQTLQRQISALPEIELVAVEVQERGAEVEVTATLYARRPVTAAFARSFSDQLRQVLARPVRVHLVVIPVTEIEVPPR